MDEKINQVLGFWFGEIHEGLTTENKQHLWYSADPQQDAEIADRFKAMLLAAVNGEYQSWRDTPKGRLALILLFDQFSRNIFRGKPRAFAYDDYALTLCLEGLALQADQNLSLIEKIFFYHPLEHSEDIQHQQRCVELMQGLVWRCEGKQKEAAENALRWAEEHRDIIQLFGRFPHRNKILGRDSTASELQFLQGGASTFGQ